MGYSPIWPIRGRVMVFGPSALNRVYSFKRVCPNQGLDLSSTGFGLKAVVKYLAI